MNTYVKSVGIAKTFINDNNEKYSNEMKWDGDYNGKIAKLNLDVNDNGRKKHLHMELNNKDLLKLLNHQSVNIPIDKRLENDYLYNKNKNKFSKKRNNNKMNNNKMNNNKMNKTKKSKKVKK
jgi:hypothetical protein